MTSLEEEVKGKKRKHESPESVAHNEGPSSEGKPKIEILQVFEDNTIEIGIDQALLESWAGKIGENDPLVIFHWSSNLARGIEVLNDNAAPPLPVWFPEGTTYPLNSTQTESLVLQACQRETTGGIVDSFVIAPNTLVESCRIVAKLAQMSMDPFFIALANECNGHIARIHLVTESRAKLTCTPCNIGPPFVFAAGDILPFV